MFAFLLYAGFATAQITTQTGCTCKSSTEVKWRLSGGKIGGGFSHYGCGTGPYEDRAPAKGRNWCDTQQSSCNNGQGWDFCIPAPAPTPKIPLTPQEVNVNLGAQQANQANGITSTPGVTLSVNLNLGGGSSSAAPGTITTVQGCTCHPTSEVIMMQNGVRVGGGFSHNGCGTGPYEAYSPGKGSPWCDTVETWCSSGWDLCVPPAGQTQLPPPQPPSYTNYPNSVNSFTTAFGSSGTYQVPPTPFTAPPTPFGPLYQPPFQNPIPSPSAYVPPSSNGFNSYNSYNSYNSNSYGSTSGGYSQPSVTNTPSYTNTFSNFNSFNTQSYTPVATPVAGPAYSPPAYSPPASFTTPSTYTAPAYTPPATGTRTTSSYVGSGTTVTTVPVPVSKSASRSPFAPQNRYAPRPRTPRTRKGPGPRGDDYDYDSSSSSSSILPFMLMSQASGSSSSNLLPLVLASKSSGSSSMLPMMMMMNSGGSSSLSSPIAQLMMFNALRREGDGEAQNSTNLGEIGQELGFTRAVTKSGEAADGAEPAKAEADQATDAEVDNEVEEDGEDEEEEDKDDKDAESADTTATSTPPPTDEEDHQEQAQPAVPAEDTTAPTPEPAAPVVDTRTSKGRKGPSPSDSP